MPGYGPLGFECPTAFEADAANPSTGTVTAANGNLIGIGPGPGDQTQWFGYYDGLDRLA